MSGTKRASGTQRVLAILDCFSADRPTLTLSDISRLAGLPLTTAHRQVGELARWGALERDHEGRYRIGLRLWEVGALAPRSIGLREAALPFLEDLYEVTHENVQLAVLDGSEVVYVERISGRQAVHVVTRPGSRLPVHATAVGLVLLAHAGPDEIDAVLSRRLRAYTEHTVTDPTRLRRTMAEIRRTGYAISDRQIELVSASVAAPVYDATRAVVAALSIVVPARGAQTRRYVPAVLAAARGISRILGGGPACLQLDADALAMFPTGYQHLAYLQREAGYDVMNGLPGLRGAAVELLYREGDEWLAGSPSPGSPMSDRET